MKILKVRANPIGSESWIEGQLIVSKEVAYPFDENEPEGNTHYYLYIEKQVEWEQPYEQVLVEVDPKTITQDTGLRDADGRRIFTEDIVKFKGKEWTVIEVDFNYYLYNSFDMPQPLEKCNLLCVIKDDIEY